tara:strand:- start:6937 stop:7653 length:717 start_codon:yes stop_codon:yes gene_type:complete
MANQTETLTQAVGYRWLAQFFLHRPSLSDLEQYRGEDGRQFLAACKAVPALSTLAELIETATATDECLAQLQAGLARAVSQAFDMAGPRTAPPYASIYLSERGLLFQQPTRDMNRILGLLRMNLPEGLNEPADHLGIQLNVAAELCDREAAGQPFTVSSTLFLETQVLSWLPAFVDRCSRLPEPGLVCMLAHSALNLVRAHVGAEPAKPADPVKVEALARVALQLVCMNYKAAEACSK